MLDITQLGSYYANSGCDIKFVDNSTQPLFVPSGNETGYKAIGQFTVPADGSVKVTADFNVREAVVMVDSHYILKPTITLTDNG
ncbi:MAG TPA: DUF4382 domain-containing protein [Dehalococcoidia bacterium]|nr:DUF4382 domain-containing protein [Dehalococcoidia bacterium]